MNDEGPWRAEPLPSDHPHRSNSPSEPLYVVSTIPPAPEFLPVGMSVHVRVSEVDFVNRFGNVVKIATRGGGIYDVQAPYFAAWLDRLGIPWTEELRKAHAAATNALCHDAPGGGLLCVRPRGHSGPHGCRLDGVDRDWLPPTHPDARAEGGAA